mgnify:CR=1 FL=1
MIENNLLSAALGYPFEIPKAPITRSIRTLFKDRMAIEPYHDKKKFVPIKHRKPEAKKDALSTSETLILKMVNRGGDVTGASAASKTRFTRNHCSMILTALFKKGLIKRRKDKGGGTRWYVYTKLEGKK